MKIHDFYSKDRFKLSPESLSEYSHIIDEEIDGLSEDEVCIRKGDLKGMSDIDLSSFRPQQELNPKVFPHGKINSKVRLRLLDIADDFVDTLDVDWVKPVDYILTGSLANYNWSKYSDFDLHILMDFNDVDDRTEFVKQYFDAKKKIWNDNHENLKIYGFPVEVYVQDINEKHTASGIYSLFKNKWIKQPERNKIRAIKLDKMFIKEKVFKFCEQINSLEQAYEDADDEHTATIVGNKAKAIFDKIKGIRREALKNGDEMSPGNIVFKCLRRFGYIGKLVDLKSKTYDKINSIK